MFIYIATVTWRVAEVSLTQTSDSMIFKPSIYAIKMKYVATSQFSYIYFIFEGFQADGAFFIRLLFDISVFFERELVL